MIDLWLTLFIKSTAVLALTLLTAAALRRRSAAVRHLVWVGGLSAQLFLPVGMALPPAAAAGSPALSAILSAAQVERLGAAGQTGAGPILKMIWLAGMLLLMARLAGGLSRAARLIRTARAIPPFQEIAVRITPGAVVPMAWGFGRGVVLLPESSIDWPEERRRAVVLHEAAHLERKDCWALAMAELVCALYWCHPLVWYAASRMRREQEQAADDHVLREGIKASEYAEHLVAIARGNRNVLLPGAASRSNLTARVNAILDNTRRRTMLTRRMAFASAAAVLAVALPLAAMQAGRKTHKIGEEGVTPPKLLQKQEPAYTEEAKDAGIEGTVVLSAVIETDGKAYDVKVERALDPGLDANAVAAIRQWLFKPGEKDSKPVAVSAKIEVNFRLR